MAEGIITRLVNTARETLDSVSQLDGDVARSRANPTAAENAMPPELAGAVQDMLAKNAATGTSGLRLFAEEPTEDQLAFQDNLRTQQYIAVAGTIAFGALALFPLVRSLGQRNSDWQMNKMLADPRIMALREILSPQFPSAALDRVLRSAAPKILQDIKAGMDPNLAIQRRLPTAILSEVDRIPVFADPREIRDAKVYQLRKLEHDASRGKFRIDVGEHTATADIVRCGAGPIKIIPTTSRAVERAAEGTVHPPRGEAAAAERARRVGEGIAGRERVGEEERKGKAGGRERVEVKPRVK
jgi:hypothetical protein